MANKKANDDKPIMYKCQDCGFETDDALESDNHAEDNGHYCMTDEE